VAVTRAAVFVAAELGVKNVGQLLRLYESEGPEWLAIHLDGLRVKAGLPTRAEVEAAKAKPPAPLTVGSSRARCQQCAEPSCAVQHTHPTTLLPESIDVRRWWCDQHRHLADPGDKEPTVRYRYRPMGGLEEVSDPTPLKGAGWEPLP
jgi:hypothetical protein